MTHLLETKPQTFSNLLLAGLSEAQLAVLAPALEPVDLPRGTMLETSGKPIGHAYFLETGIGSTVAENLGGQRVEVGLFGWEGMSGLPLVLGADRSSHETTMQGPGQGLRIAAPRLREAMRADPSIRERLLLYVQAMGVQSAQTAIANGRHSIEQRLARWLLMSHDRVEGDILDLTHGFLAVMLGVRRAGVTVAVHMLEGRRILKANRGRIQVLDRSGLETAAKESYGAAEAEYARLLGYDIAARKVAVGA